MADVTVPQAPPLARLPNVELMHTGEWNISTGVFTFTAEDLTNAVASQDCPAVRRPVLKLGHTDPRFDGEPAVGYVDNLGVAEDGRTLVGDYAGMPGWLGDVIASAYPDRSIEGQYDFRCQMGHTHPFVLTAVALLGVSAPGIGTLQSLQDVAALYGVAAAAPEPTGIPVTVVVHASSQEASVPNPHPRQIAAGVTTEDVRRKFYASPVGMGWDIWIEEMQLDPELQIICIDDATGARTRVPVVIGAGDGEDAVSFGDPVKVVVRYEDAPTTAAASAGAQPVRFASRAESRPDAPPQSPAATSAGGPSQEGADVSDTLLPNLRQKLGIADESTDETAVLAALDEALAERAEPTPQTPPNPEPAPEPAPDPAPTPEPSEAQMAAASVPEEWRRQLEAATSQLARINAANAAAARKTLLDGAVRAGKIAPADRSTWEQRYDKAPAVIEEILASTAEGAAVPVQLVGAPGSEEDSALDADYRALFGDERVNV